MLESKYFRVSQKKKNLFTQLMNDNKVGLNCYFETHIYNGKMTLNGTESYMDVYLMLS